MIFSVFDIQVSNHTRDFTSVSWTAPDKTGGTNITHYILEMKEGDDLKFKVKERHVKGLTYDVTSLREGVQYVFRVIAVNAVGEGMPSGPSQQVKYGKYILAWLFTVQYKLKNVCLNVGGGPKLLKSLYRTVEDIIFTRTLQDAKVTEVGVSTKFECETSKEGLKVEWFFGNKTIKRDLHYDVIDEGRVHRLVINSVDGSDMGEYRVEYLHLETRAKLAVEGIYLNHINQRHWT